MASRKTWVWVLVAGGGLVVAALVALAGAGMYFVAQHIRTERSTSAAAMRAFDASKARFAGARPLIEVSDTSEPVLVGSLEGLPTSRERPDTVSMLAWDPRDERLVRVSLPLWMLRFGTRHMKVRLMQDDRGFDLSKLNLDVDELERIGPALVFDFRTPDGARVLIWTH
jgi:hypothetical protein